MTDSSAPSAKRLRAAGAGGLVNTLRLSPKRNLPEHIERCVLLFLNMWELGLMPWLSKDMNAMVTAFFRNAHHLRFGCDPTFFDTTAEELSDASEGCAGSAWTMLRHCCQLRTLELPPLGTAFEARTRRFLVQCVRRNAATLERIICDGEDDQTLNSLQLLGALASCPQLTHFDHTGGFAELPSFEIYNAVLTDVAACCPLLSDVALRNTEWPDNDGGPDEQDLFPETVAAFLPAGPRLRRVLLQAVPTPSVELVAGLSRLEVLKVLRCLDWAATAAFFAKTLPSLRCLQVLEVSAPHSVQPNVAWTLPSSVTSLVLNAFVADLAATGLSSVEGLAHPAMLVPLLNSNTGLTRLQLRPVTTDAARPVPALKAPLRALTQLIYLQTSISSLAPGNFLSQLDAPALRFLHVNMQATPGADVTSLLSRLPKLEDCILSAPSMADSPAVSEPSECVLPALKSLRLSLAHPSLFVLRLPNLRSLELWSTHVRMDAATFAARSSHLTELKLSRIQSVTDSALLAAIKAMPKLERLKVGCPKVSVVFLVKLPCCAPTTLQTLCIELGTAIPAEAYCESVLGPLVDELPELVDVTVPLAESSAEFKTLADVLHGKGRYLSSSVE